MVISLSRYRGIVVSPDVGDPAVRTMETTMKSPMTMSMRRGRAKERVVADHPDVAT